MLDVRVQLPKAIFDAGDCAVELLLCRGEVFSRYLIVEMNPIVGHRSVDRHLSETVRAQLEDLRRTMEREGERNAEPLDHPGLPKSGGISIVRLNRPLDRIGSADLVLAQDDRFKAVPVDVRLREIRGRNGENLVRVVGGALPLHRRASLLQDPMEHLTGE